MAFQVLRMALISFGLLLFISGCHDVDVVDAPNVDHIQSDIAIIRFDKMLFPTDTSDLISNLEKLKKDYSNMYEIYFNNIISLSRADSSVLNQEIVEYLFNPASKKLYDTVSIEYPTLDNIEQEFNEAFQYFKYYFPAFIIPNVYTLVSDFSYQNFIIDDGDKDGIGIGLDMYLGSTFPYKGLDPQNPSFSDYLTRTFNRDHIVSKSIKMLLDDQVGAPPGVRFLDQMFHNGKKLYLLDKILPYTNDTIIIEYSLQQYEWVRANEIQIWSFFTDENLLYETNMSKINKYLRPAPSSPGMPPEAPGSTANYIGWQIVNAYMQKYPETTVEELISMDNSQDFLELSRYRPNNRK